MKIEIEWVTLENRPDQRKRAPWKRTLGIADNGEIFAPATLAGDEKAVFLCASFDGAAIAEFSGHVFVPISWLVANYPDDEMLQACKTIKTIVSDIKKEQ